jgi:hypothetical protein
VSGNVVKLKDTSSTPSYVACPGNQEGTYTVTYSPDCKTVTFAKSGEPCPGREVAVARFVGTRK